jgi:hypothetical protein
MTPLPLAQPVGMSTNATEESAGGTGGSCTVASTVWTTLGLGADWLDDAVGDPVPVGVATTRAVDGETIGVVTQAPRARLAINDLETHTNDGDLRVLPRSDIAHGLLNEIGATTNE